MKKYVDKKLFFILLGYVLAYHVIYISRRVALKMIKNDLYEDISWTRTILEPIFANFIMITPIIILILIVTKIMIDKNYSWKYIVIAHFFFSIVYVGLIFVSNVIYLNLVNKIPMGVFTREGVVMFLFNSNLNFLGYVGFVGIIYSYYYIQRTSKAELQKVQLSEQLTNVKIQALKSQLNPHFLFNTLNSISSLIQQNSDKAQYMISNLGDLFREILLLKHENKIPVYEEIKILMKYVEIMEVRFSDHLSVNLTIEPQSQNVLIPSMILQPIVENSIRHGYSADNTELEVHLNIYKELDKLVIEIKNNGNLIDRISHIEGMGIRNIQERLKTIYGDNFEFKFSNLEGRKGVITCIKVPFF